MLLLLPGMMPAQKIDHSLAFRDIKSDTYLRMHYDNDYFSATDKNYTQGYSLELVAPFLEKNPVSLVLIQPKKFELRHGLAVEHIGYTPSRIGPAEVQYGERPFAAAIMLKNFVIATDTLQQSRLHSSLNIGLIGPGALGREMQTSIHKVTGNTIPQGWRNQIQNDLVLTYDLGYEKQLLRAQDWGSLSANSSARLGTLFTNASLGLQTTVGLINSPFTALNAPKRFQLYAYSQVSGSLIGYDATLQGGVFNKKSPYTIPSNEIERFTGQFNYGFVLQTKSLYLEYFRAAITREFESGKATRWGGIRIGLQL